MDDLVLLAIALAIAGMFVVWRTTPSFGTLSRRMRKNRVSYLPVVKSGPHSGQPYRAVSIQASTSHACDAAIKLQERRYLAREAPHLPLPGCKSPRCNCVYAHHADRREEEDRRAHFFGGRLVKAKSRRHDRRASGGRRAGDLVSLW